MWWVTFLCAVYMLVVTAAVLVKISSKSDKFWIALAVHAPVIYIAIYVISGLAS